MPVVAATLFAAFLAVAPDHSIDDVSRRAFEYAAKGEIGMARALLEESYASSKAPVLLYVRATIELEARNCAGALEYFEAFIETNPPAQDRTAAQRQIDECRSVVGPEPSAPEVVVAPPAPTPDPPPDAPDDDPPKRKPDPIGVALVGGGGALILAGGGMLIAAASGRADGGAASSTEGDYGVRVRRLSIAHYAGISVVSVGAVLAIAGAIKWGLASRKAGDGDTAKRTHASPRVSFGLTADGLNFRF